MTTPPASQEIRNFDLSHKTVAEILGEITWLMTQDAVWKTKSISTIEKVVIPAITLKRFRVFYIENKPEAEKADISRRPGIKPVGVVFWEVSSKRKHQDSGVLIEENSVAARDNLSDNIEPCITFVVAPFGGEEKMRNTIVSEIRGS